MWEGRLAGVISPNRIHRGLAGKTTPEKQQQFINRISQAGGLAFIARSVEVVQARISAQAGAGQSGGV
jgi:hypothetical protein